MVLNYDCLRSVLLSLENLLKIDQVQRDQVPGSSSNDIVHDKKLYLRFQSISLDEIMKADTLRPYEKEDLFYAIYNLEQAGYISACIKRAGNCVTYCAVSDITYEGHMFLKNVHDDTVWAAVKRKIGPMAHASLPVLLEVAASCVMGRSV